MAMNGAQMGLEVAAATRAVFSAIPQNSPVPDGSVDNIWIAAGTAIVNHIQFNATVTVPAGSSAGVYPVTGMSGATLGANIASSARAVFSVIPNNVPIPGASIDAIWQSISGSIVSYIQSTATVVVPSGSSAGSYSISGMSGATMGASVASSASAVYTAIPNTAPVPDASVDAIWEAIAAAIVLHIQTNGVVIISVGDSAGTYPVQ